MKRVNCSHGNDLLIFDFFFFFLCSLFGNGFVRRNFIYLNWTNCFLFRMEFVCDEMHNDYFAECLIDCTECTINEIECDILETICRNGIFS